MPTTCPHCGTTPNVACCEFGMDHHHDDKKLELTLDDRVANLSQRVHDLMFTLNK